MIDYGTHVTVNGSLFNGRLKAVIEDTCEDWEHEFAQHAHGMVHARLRQVLKHPTGYYQSQVVVDRIGTDWQVTDSGVIYGPWLEGTGSRNYPVTRFKGYATFRQTTQRLQRDAEPMMQRMLRTRLVAHS